MKVTATTWTYEGDDDTPTRTTETFTSQRAFIEAGYSEFIWSSFARGLTDKWNEDGILKIPEWLAISNNFPYAEEDRTGSTDWCGYAAVTLDDSNETDKALYIDALRTSDTPILSGTNGLRSRRTNEYVPKSEVTLLKLTEEPACDSQCWCCGLPLQSIRDSALDSPKVSFQYTGGEEAIRQADLLCADCTESADIEIGSTENLGTCSVCGRHDATCKEFVTSEGDSLYQWRCSDHRPERVTELRTMTRENYAYL